MAITTRRRSTIPFIRGMAVMVRMIHSLTLISYVLIPPSVPGVNTKTLFVGSPPFANGWYNLAMNEISSSKAFAQLGILLGRLQSIAEDILVSTPQSAQAEASLEALPGLVEIKELLAVLSHLKIVPSFNENLRILPGRLDKPLWYLLAGGKNDPLKTLRQLLTDAGRRGTFTRQQILKAMQTLLQIRILGMRALEEGAILSFFSFQSQNTQAPLILRYEGNKSRYHFRTGLRRIICLTQTRSFGAVQIEFLLGPEDTLQITISTEKNRKAMNQDPELSRIARELNARIRTRRLVPAKAQPLWMKINAKA